MAVALKACVEALDKFHKALILGSLTEAEFRTGITESTGTSKTIFEVIGIALKEQEELTMNHGHKIQDHGNKIQETMIAVNNQTTTTNNQVGALTVGMTGMQQQVQAMANELNAIKQQQQNQGTPKRNQPILDSKAIQGIKGYSGDRSEFRDWTEKFINIMSQVRRGSRHIMESMNKHIDQGKTGTIGQ